MPRNSYRHVGTARSSEAHQNNIIRESSLVEKLLLTVIELEGTDIIQVVRGVHIG
jgi:hypothetical protein